MKVGLSVGATLVAMLGLVSLPAVAIGVSGIVLCAGSAWAETPIVGIGVNVTTKADGVIVASGVSGETGDVRFNDLAPGEYLLRVGQSKPTEFVIAEGNVGVLVRITGKRRNYVGHVSPLH